MKRKKMSKPIFALGLAALSLITISISSCAKREMDSHAAPRETKAYESVDPAELAKTDLLAHLETLLAETIRATAAGEAVELHHIEAALTPTLDALEKIATDENNAKALASIASLKPMAIKLHQAGHDSNTTMGSKLADVIAKQGNALIDELR